MQTSLLEIRELRKEFPGVRALAGISFSMDRGELTGLVGENGAGKSTLMRILAGEIQPTSGSLIIDGKSTVINNPIRARELGIAIIHQELSLHDNLDVVTNLFLGREICTFGFRRQKTMLRKVEQVLHRVGLTISPRTFVGSLAPSQQQLVEISRAVLGGARIIVMDEPTSCLSKEEAENLFRLIHELKLTGTSILYVSHRLREIEDLADKVIVLRDGVKVGTLSHAEVTHDRMVSMMVGRNLAASRVDVSSATGPVALELDQLSTRTFPHAKVSLQLRQGEIVGIAGLMGAGRTELLRAIFGIDRRGGGHISVHGIGRPLKNPGDAIAAGIGFVPEDRKEQGLILAMSVRQNIGLAKMWVDRILGVFHNRRRERSLAADSITQLSIKAASDSQLVQLLSGGNQQKVILAKWLALQPSVLLLDEPTRGIDVAARAQIYDVVRNLAQAGTAILFASSEMEELLSLAQRVIVLRQGEVAGQLSRDEMTEESILRLAMPERRLAV